MSDEPFDDGSLALVDAELYLRLHHCAIKSDLRLRVLTTWADKVLADASLIQLVREGQAEIVGVDEDGAMEFSLTDKGVMDGAKMLVEDASNAEIVATDEPTTSH